MTSTSPAVVVTATAVVVVVSQCVVLPPPTEVSSIVVDVETQCSVVEAEVEVGLEVVPGGGSKLPSMHACHGMEVAKCVLIFTFSGCNQSIFING